MKKSLWIAISVIALVGFCWLTQAGNLEPPGSPASTMVTLQELYDRLDSLTLGVVGVPKTGQTSCWNASGTPISCAGTGQDGEYQMGVSVDPRFTDNGDGTVKDNLTGLIWLQNMNCFGTRTWATALADANGLADGSCGLTDSSVAGDWRLPNRNELLSLIDPGQHGPALTPGHPFTNVITSFYWSSTTLSYISHYASYVDTYGGDVNADNKSNTWYVWPVRGGL